MLVTGHWPEPRRFGPPNAGKCREENRVHSRSGLLDLCLQCSSLRLRAFIDHAHLHAMQNTLKPSAEHTEHEERYKLLLRYPKTVAKWRPSFAPTEALGNAEILHSKFDMRTDLRTSHKTCLYSYLARWKPLLSN